MRTNDDGEDLGPEERPPPPEARADIEPMSRGLLRMAGIPADEDVLDAALHLVVALTRGTVGGADGVSICLNRRKTLTTVAAATRRSAEWTATRRHRRGTVRRRGDAGALVPRRGARRRTSLELSSWSPSRASDLLVSAAIDVSTEDLSRQLQEALRGRDVIAQALSAPTEHGLSADNAYAMLRRSSRRSDTPLRRVAADVMSSTQAAPGCRLLMMPKEPSEMLETARQDAMMS